MEEVRSLERPVTDFYLGEPQFRAFREGTMNRQSITFRRNGHFDIFETSFLDSAWSFGTYQLEGVHLKLSPDIANPLELTGEGKLTPSGLLLYVKRENKIQELILDVY